MKKIFIMAFTAIFAGMILSSCEKEDVEKTNPNSNLKSSLEMRVFDDVVALNEEVTKTTQMSFEELVSYDFESEKENAWYLLAPSSRYHK